MNDTDRLLRLPEVLAATGLGRATLYRYLQMGKFPSAVRIGERSVAWRWSAVQRWIEERPTVDLTG